MSNPTSNFGWVMPTSTDLVTDLPADFEVFGQAVDTSLADLKGGTTGQILSKASNTNMDFTWITNDVGDITEVVAGTGITGGGTSGAVTVSFDQANFGGGQLAGAKNKILNSNMSIWQRGTSFAGTTLGAYCADRWGYYRGGAAGGATWSRQNSGLTGIQYGLRAQRDSGNTSTQYLGTWQSIETANSYAFAGQTVTISFYAKCGANYSATSNALAVTVITGTGTDQAIYSFTGSTNAITGTATLTTSYQRFSYTGTLSSALTQIGVQFIGTPTGTAGANDWYEITGVQLEQGSTATPFQTATGTIQGELAACQRYYFRQNAGSLSGFAIYGTGFANTTGLLNIPVVYPVTMRVKPTALDTSAMNTFSWEVGVTSGNTPTTITLDTNYSSPDGGMAVVAKAATFVVATYYRLGANNNSSSYLGWSAEL